MADTTKQSRMARSTWTNLWSSAKMEFSRTWRRSTANVLMTVAMRFINDRSCKSAPRTVSGGGQPCALLTSAPEGQAFAWFWSVKTALDPEQMNEKLVLIAGQRLA